MTIKVRLVVPYLFEQHMLDIMDHETRQLVSRLKQKLAKANCVNGETINVYEALYHLADEHLQFTPWLVDSEEAIAAPFLRADPVILEPTHNGIVCRGNDILHLDPDEQQEIEGLFNDYFEEQGLTLTFYSPHQAMVLIAPDNRELLATVFSPLKDVLGQDITHHLPSGTSAKVWQTILMETQMLLHRAECNQLRIEQGEKPVGSLWFWGETKTPSVVSSDALNHIYTDHTVLRRAFTDKTSDITSISEIINHRASADIVTDRLERACIQNDLQRWQSGMQFCCETILFPAIDALLNNQLQSLELITDTDHYSMKPWHRYRFWRK